jgi:hypothetical protein
MDELCNTLSHSTYSHCYFAGTFCMQMEERYNNEHSSVDESVVVQMDCLEQSFAPWIGRTIKTAWEPGKIVRSHDSTGKEI